MRALNIEPTLTTWYLILRVFEHETSEWEPTWLPRRFCLGNILRFVGVTLFVLAFDQVKWLKFSPFHKLLFVNICFKL